MDSPRGALGSDGAVEASFVSICIPVRNGSRWIDETIDSALAQTLTDFELLVVDDSSTDDTVERVRARDDERIRVVVNERPAGPAANHSRCVELAGGQAVKFLHHDDLLYPTCIETMAEILEAHPAVGLVFCRRDVLLENPDDAAAVRWRERYGVLDRGFGSIASMNWGPDLVRQYVPALRGPHVDNWIGEPSVVMIRRSCFDRVGLFNIKMHLTYDLEMWLRVAAVSDVAFIDEPLVGYRHHSASWTAETAQSRGNWLDLLWLLEGLLESPGFEDYRRRLKGYRRRESARTAKRQARRLLRGARDLRPLGDYLSHRLAIAVGKRRSLHVSGHLPADRRSSDPESVHSRP
jgi:glycosyltransferase involved in cell wall biosynthesis